MHTRREMMARSVTVAGLLAAAGFLPTLAHAAWPQAAFEAKTLADAVKALGGSAPVESKDVTLSGPDIAENGAVVPIGAATTLPGVKHLLLLVEKNPNALVADVRRHRRRRGELSPRAPRWASRPTSTRWRSRATARRSTPRRKSRSRSAAAAADSPRW